jgi:hypothetical protein
MASARTTSAVERRGDLLELSGTTVAASWDAFLAPALSRHRVAVPEERVLEELLGDLSSH